jgi:hypothetical protein
MNRSHRRIVAWLGVLGIAFAQVAVTAHACMIRGDAGPRLDATVAHMDHCAGEANAAVPLAPQSNACELQCTDGATASAGPDLPPVALVSLPVASAPRMLAVDVREWDRSILAANSAGPPPLLQYCRLLN